MGKLDRESLKRLKNLLEIVSPSMQEDEILDYLREQWSGICPSGRVRHDVMGNLEFSIIQNDSFPTLALVAHADTVCIQITSSIGDGKFRFRSVGLSPHTLLGQQMIVLTEDRKRFDGVIGFDATSQFGQPKGLIFEDLWLDIPGQGQNVMEITPGDLAVLRPNVSVGESTVTAPGLDDRIGLFLIGEALKYYSENINETNLNLICVATAQEEVGLRGSGMFEFSHRPDAVIVLDVDYATDIPNSHEDQMGRLWLHHGPGVQRKSDNNPEVRRIIKDAADKIEKPLQVSLGRFLYGGTDGTQLQMTRGNKGYAVANLTIPCRYMHSPAETISQIDVVAASDILCCMIDGFTII